MCRSAVAIASCCLSLLSSGAVAREARLAYAAVQPENSIEERIERAFADDNVAAAKDGLVEAQPAPPQEQSDKSSCAPLDPALVSRLVRKLATEEGIDPDLADAVAWVESRYGANAGPSASGAVGIMQLMPDTARDMGITDRCEPEANIRAGLRYMKRLYAEFKDPLLMLAAYNAGPAKVYEKQGIPVYRETSEYIVQVLNRWKLAAMVQPPRMSDKRPQAQMKQDNTSAAEGPSAAWKDGHVIELE